ncbi:MAG: ribokinase [Planctomycetota bacterium]
MVRIFVVGSLNMDVVLAPHRFPRKGETLPVPDVSFHPGGKGGNAAVAAARCGARVSFVGVVGDDPFGRRLLESLRAESIDARAVRLDPRVATGCAIIFVDRRSGENRIMVSWGANARLSAAQVRAARSRIARAAAVLLSFETPPQAISAACRIARSKGILTVLDAGPVRAADLKLLPLIDVVSPNESEAAALTGLPLRGPRDAVAAARRLIKAGAREVVMKLGEKGSLWTDGKNVLSAPAFRIKPVDTTGAGDAFTGAFAVARAKRLPVEQALRYANAAGALACLVPGAQPSMPTDDAVRRFLRAHS